MRLFCCCYPSFVIALSVHTNLDLPNSETIVWGFFPQCTESHMWCVHRLLRVKVQICCWHESGHLQTIYWWICLLFNIFHKGLIQFINPLWNISATLHGYYSSLQSSATQSWVHAGSFHVSIIHQTRTWTTGSLACVHDHSYECIYTQGLGTPTASQDTFDSEKLCTNNLARDTTVNPPPTLYIFWVNCCVQFNEEECPPIVVSLFMISGFYSLEQLKGFTVSVYTFI